MSTIISASFRQAEDTRQAVDDLERHGIAGDKTHVFHMDGQNPPRLGEAEHTQAVRIEALDGGALEGLAKGGMLGVAVGLVAAPLIGPAAILAGAGIGAYGGSLLGAMHRMSDDLADPEKETGSDLDQAFMSGDRLAVRVDSEEEQRLVIDILREHHADAIARGQGEVGDGHWEGFDPSKATLLPDGDQRPGLH